MADETRPDKIIPLAGDAGPLKPCMWCDTTSGKLSPGKGPHAASIRCLGCKRHLAWISPKMLASLQGSAA